MAERITVAPDELRRAAGEHRDAAERLSAVGSGNDEIMATLDSLGPVFGDLREAGRILLDERRACYQQQAAAHTELAERLNAAADGWEQQDSDAARSLGALAGEDR